ncbi:hypothetical protein DM02DRAFT_682584, partial [Periconia macrospinosa]
MDGANIPASDALYLRSPSTPLTSPSSINIEQSVQERLTDNKGEVGLRIIGRASSGNSSGSDVNDKSYKGKSAAFLTRKRKRPAQVDGISQKRQSRTLTMKRSTTRAKHTTSKRKRSLPQKKVIASRSADSRLALGTLSGEHDGNQPKSAGIDTGGVWCPNAENPYFTLDPPHATGRTRFSAK